MVKVPYRVLAGRVAGRAQRLARVVAAPRAATAFSAALGLLAGLSAVGGSIPAKRRARTRATMKGSQPAQEPSSTQGDWVPSAELEGFVEGLQAVYSGLALEHLALEVCHRDLSAEDAVQGRDQRAVVQSSARRAAACFVDRAAVAVRVLDQIHALLASQMDRPPGSPGQLPTARRSTVDRVARARAVAEDARATVAVLALGDAVRVAGSVGAAIGAVLAELGADPGAVGGRAVLRAPAAVAPTQRPPTATTTPPPTTSPPPSSSGPAQGLQGLSAELEGAEQEGEELPDFQK